ncbi:MAG: hypothetical protein OXE40_14035 [Gammaproteobacteria bacterium]|nr:hypothetical protein [Gammaproteobacteria bacterium]
MEASTPNKPGLGAAGGCGPVAVPYRRNRLRWRVRRRCGGVLLVMAVLAFDAGPAVVWSAEKAPAAKRLDTRHLMTPESAAGVARRETGGRVLSVTPLDGGQQGYRIRLLLDGGRVTTVLVDPRGGIRRQR